MWTSRNFWPKLEKGYVLLIYFEQIVSFCAIFYSNTNSLQLFCENSNLNSANFTERVFFCVSSWKYFSQLSLVTFVTNSTSGWNPCSFIVKLVAYLSALMSVVVSDVKPLHTCVEQALRNAKTFKYKSLKYALRTWLPSHNVEISSTLIPIICSQRPSSRRERRKPGSGGSSSFCPQVRRQIL